MNRNLLLETEPRRNRSEFPFYTYWMPDEKLDAPLVLPHWHDDMEILYTEAEGVLNINDREYPMHPGDVFFINPRSIHRTSRKSHGLMSHIVFDLSILVTAGSAANDVNRLIDSVIRGRKGVMEKPGKELSVAILPVIQEIVSHGEHTVEYGYESSKILSLLFSVLAECLRAEAFRDESGEDLYGIRYITEVMDFIRDHYAEPLTADTLAASVGISSTYLYRLFRDYAGLSPVNYINTIRLREAYLLLEEGCNVTETALAVGIPNTSYFIKLFKDSTGKSPHQWIRDKRKASV